MQILLNETEFLNEVLIKDIFNISVHQWHNLQQPHSTQWFLQKWYFMHLNIFGNQRELPLNFPCN